MFCDRIVLDLIFSLTKISSSSIRSSMPDILSFLSCILLVGLPRFPFKFLNLQFQTFLSLSFLCWFHFHFQVWIYFIHFLPLCFHRFFKKYLFSSIRANMMCRKTILRPFSCASARFYYSRPAVVGVPSFGRSFLSWLLLCFDAGI